MPGQLHEYAVFRTVFLYFLHRITCSIQQSYAREFTTFKPDKKLRWLSHLGSIRLDIQLQDRTVSADVPPLEAAFIELFSEQGMILVSCERGSNLALSHVIRGLDRERPY